MDRSEYMRLMRLQREKLLASSKMSFDAVSKGKDALPADLLGKALEMQGIHPSVEMIEELLRPYEGCTVFSFEQFVRLVYRGQEVAAVEGRKRAGFSDGVFKVLQRIFKTCDKEHRGSITFAELVCFLSESKVPMNTFQHREQLVKSLDAARAAALASGLPASQVGETGGHRCLFWDFVHLIRVLARKNEEEADAREKEVVERTRFSPAEVAQFRQYFSSMVAELRTMNYRSFDYDDVEVTTPAQPGSSQRPDGPPLALVRVMSDLLDTPTLPPLGITKVLSTIGLHVSIEQREDLIHKLFDFTPEETQDVDFACFLQLMRWMLDTDFANINGTAKKAVDRLRHQGNCDGDAT
jgi:hypothetical protein